MKTLLLLRHAKSSWKHAELEDHDRPLNKRGKTDAPRIGQLLLDEHLVPDRILSSSARRARKTARIVAKACGFEAAIELHPELYLASPEVYLSVLHALPDEVDTVLVVGHNPGLEELLHKLTGRAEALPTAALAQVVVNVDRWERVGRGARGRLLSLWHPPA